MIYDYYKEKNKKGIKFKLLIIIAVIAIIIAAVLGGSIYLEIIQLDEIGSLLSSVFIKNLLYKVLFSVISFIIIFILISLTNTFAKKNIKEFFKEKNLEAHENRFIDRKLPGLIITIIISLIGAFTTKEFFYLKALSFFNSMPFGTKDPLFARDIGYYIFERPFLMSIYEFFSTLWLIIIIYTVIFYLIMLFITFSNVTLQDLKFKAIVRHNLINIAVFFAIKAFSYKFMKEGILYSGAVGVTGAGYADYNVWLKYYTIAPVLLILIVIAAFIFISKAKLKKAAVAIAVFPAVWLLTTIISFVVQSFIVSPNEFNLESRFLKYNIEQTRKAYDIDNIANYEFSDMVELTPEIINRNFETKNNIRIVDYQSTLVSDIQLQSNTNFYTFNDGDIINYVINGKETPVFITAREVDKNRLPDKTYLNTTYKYTHGYGVVMNPINRLTKEGQIDFIVSGLRLKSADKNIIINEPRIYYGELTKDYVIVNAANNLDEIDYDGNDVTRYNGNGGIKLNALNRLLFSLKYADFNMLISGYAGGSTLLPNREIVSRAQRAVPFLTVDKDPYIILTGDGRLKWVLDAYTSSSYYPYSQNYGSINYIRNSVKIVIDAYDGKVKYYIIDKDDPIIKAYSKIYPGIFSEDPVPDDVAAHMRYPEMLFKIQTEIMKRYHLKPESVSEFYTKQDLWDIAKYPGDKDSNNVRDIDPYYNMIKLPGGVGEKEELVLMRPFTPSGELKHNMVSWLAVRNSNENYGEMILFNFPKNTNIFGPYQVEVKINQIDKVSKDMTLWGQSGSDVYKGSLLVIPIENSILYVEPIYIRAAGTSSIPEVREIIVGYQSGDEFKYGIGTNLDAALNDLFAGVVPLPVTSAQPAEQREEAVENKVISDILSKYDELKKQLEELGELIQELK